jgi:hypothetical protein
MVTESSGLCGMKCVNYCKEMHLELNSYVCGYFNSYVYLVHNISFYCHFECPKLFHMPMYNADKIF